MIKGLPRFEVVLVRREDMALRYYNNYDFYNNSNMLLQYHEVTTFSHEGDDKLSDTSSEISLDNDHVIGEDVGLIDNTCSESEISELTLMNNEGSYSAPLELLLNSYDMATVFYWLVILSSSILQ